jgi:hypothetical protein
VVSNFSLQPNLLDSRISQDALPDSNGKEIWPQVIEQAYAQLAGGVANIANGGNSAYANKAMSGKMGTIMQPQGFSLSMLQKLINANDTIVFDTYPDAFGPLTNGLVGDHAYAYNGCTPTGANTTLNLVNPWGFANPTPVSLKSVLQDFSAIEVGHA